MSLARVPPKKLEDALWLIPIEDRRWIDSQREGMLESLNLGNYLLLVEYTGRLLRRGKASITAEVADIIPHADDNGTNWSILNQGTS